MRVTIVENSWFAKVAAWKLGSDQVAMVLGSTIHLHQCSREDFLSNINWVRHEVAHVHQWNRLGYLRFAFLYLLESINKGYFYNRFEVEARSKEQDPLILNEIEIV